MQIGYFVCAVLMCTEPVEDSPLGLQSGAKFERAGRGVGVVSPLQRAAVKWTRYTVKLHLFRATQPLAPSSHVMSIISLDVLLCVANDSQISLRQCALQVEELQDNF